MPHLLASMQMQPSDGGKQTPTLRQRTDMCVRTSPASLSLMTGTYFILPRCMSKDVQDNLIQSLQNMYCFGIYRNQNIRVVLGGGRMTFLKVNETDPEYPEDESKVGKRLDMNLIEVTE